MINYGNNFKHKIIENSCKIFLIWLDFETKLDVLSIFPIYLLYKNDDAMEKYDRKICTF